MTAASVARVAVALLSLVGVCCVVLTLAGVSVRREAVVAVLRAGVQLALVALVIAWVFRHPQGVAVYLAVMVTVAAWTSTRRIGLGLATMPTLALAITAGTLAAVGPVLASGALEPGARTVLPFTAQIVGGAMTAASLTGSRLRDDAQAEWSVVEGWLALGAPPRRAVMPHARRAVGRALVPAIDQTRSAGLVTLPGAFVGLLLGGASPAQAAVVQLLVLAGLLAAESVAAVLAAVLLAGRVGALRPVLAAG